MGVHVGGRPVRGPAGVSDGGRRGRHRVTFHAFDEIGEPSGLLAHHCMPHARSDERHSRRVVPAVFQALQFLKTHLRGLPHAAETLPAYPTIPHMVSQLSPDATKPPTSQSAM